MILSKSIAVYTDDGPLHVVHEGHGPALVLLHPGGLDLSVWDELAASLAKVYHVVRFDARSHGQSATAHTDHSPALDLLRVLDALAIDRAHLVGCSMGAMTAAEVAIRMPERVHSLGLIGGEIWPDAQDTDPFIVEYTNELTRAIAETDGDRWISAMLRMTVDGPRRKPNESPHETRERIARLLTRSIQLHASATGRQMWTPVRHRLSEISVPTLVIIGQWDSLAVHTTAKLIAKEVQDVHSVHLSRTGHLAMLETPQRTITELSAHLSRSQPELRTTQHREEPTE